MIYTSLYYDKNNFERKKKQSKQPHVEGGWRPVMVASPYHVVVAPPVALRRESAPHHIASSAPCIHPASSCSQRWWGVLSSSSTLVVGPRVV